ncbi:MAG TPA: hypothetical protein VN969_26005 [Streptosporangiaceae bacterium]|jgi:hypothetical protein|nr:hypothetical protein [Streptosporangiaceae bacterium]
MRADHVGAVVPGQASGRIFDHYRQLRGLAGISSHSRRMILDMIDSAIRLEQESGSDEDGRA